MIEWMAERLPSRYIEMWLLSEYFGFTMQDVADTFNCSISAVKSTLYRTRMRLRRLNHEKDDDADVCRIYHFDVECWSWAILRNLPPCL
jgi:RNA polymerase sigma-70 factor (ECF subfamily)